MKIIGILTSQKYSDVEAIKIAYETGKEIAKSGCVLLCGGLEAGMESACKGAKEAGGITVGILPGTTKDEANKYVDIALPTGIGFARNLQIALSCDGIVLIKGGIGALIETGYATLYKVPVIAIKGSGGTADKLADKTLDENKCEKVLVAKTPKEAVEKLLKLIK